MTIPASPNFSRDEVLRASDSLNVAEVAQLQANISRTLRVLEAVRVTLGNRPITINSLARSPNRNEAVGGVASSDHLSGLAADITVAGMTPLQVAAQLAPNAKALGIDQIIVGPSYVHIGAGLRERGQVLVSLGNGSYRPFTQGEASPIVTTARAPQAGALAPEPGTGPGALGFVVALIVGLVIFLTQRAGQ